jgi:hypothetical protein
MRSWKMDMGNNKMPKFLVARQDQAREHVVTTDQCMLKR